jgi:hypothetical protein
VGHRLLIHEVSRSHTTTHHNRLHSSGRVISPSHGPLPNNTQHSQQTDIHVSGGIRTHNLSRRAAADPRFRPQGHWTRHRALYTKDSSLQISPLGQGCTNPRHLVAGAVKFCKASTNVHGSSVWNVVSLKLLAPSEVAPRFMDCFCTPAIGYRVPRLKVCHFYSVEYV